MARIVGNVSDPPAGLLGDTSGRDYGSKLQLFSACAEPELRRAIASLQPAPGTRVLDAGCGTGEVLEWLSSSVQPGGVAVGLDLAAAHTLAARRHAGPAALVLQGDLAHAPFADGQFDLVWCANTIHHLHDPLAGIHALARLLRSGGRIAIGQSGLVPEMFFSWDARLERLVHDAVRAYYRDRYGLEERQLTAVRAVLGLLRSAGLARITVNTLLIERCSPLRAADERYLVKAIFQGTWAERLGPYLPPDDFVELSRLCDPGHRDFVLARSDFHFIQSFTLAVGHAF